MNKKTFDGIAKTIAVFVFRVMAIILALGSIVIMVRGYITTIGGRVEGPRVYIFGIVFAFLAGGLWRLK